MEECGKAREAIGALADGELGIGEEADLQTHLSGCPECAREFGERKGFAASLGESIREAMKGVKAAPRDRADLAERMTAVAHRRHQTWPRFAAAAAVFVLVGIAAYALGLFSRDPIPTASARPLLHETAEKVAELDAAKERYEKLLQEIERLTDEVRSQLPPDEQATHADRTVSMELCAIEDWTSQAAGRTDNQALPDEPKARIDRLLGDLSSQRAPVRAAARRSLRSLGPESLPHLEAALERARAGDRWFLRRVASSLRQKGDDTGKVEFADPAGGVEFRQYADARVEVVVTRDGKPQRIQARSMNDLLRRHGTLCKELQIAGCDGWVTVRGIKPAGMDLDGQLDIAFAALNDVDFSPYRREAYARVLAGRARNQHEIEMRVLALEARCRKAEEPRSAAPAVDPALVERTARRIGSWDEARLRAALTSAERELDEMRRKLDDGSRLRGRIGGLKIYVQEVRAAQK